MADVSYCQDCFVIWLMFLIIKIALLVSRLLCYMADVSYCQKCFGMWLMLNIALLYG